MRGLYVDVFSGITYDELFPMIKQIGFDGFFSGECYDCGHEACHTEGERFLPKIGNRLLCTHIHDNDKKTDLHLIPFDGQIDFARIADELRACNYSGNLTLELCYDDGCGARISKMDYLQRAFDAAMKLQKLIEK